MKLLVITAIKAFENEIKQLLKQAGVGQFSYRDVNGYRDATLDALESNWFGSEMNENESVLFYAFVKKENVDTLFTLADNFNAHQESQSKVHIVVLNIEKTN
jgi:hypothetical protein